MAKHLFIQLLGISNKLNDVVSPFFFTELKDSEKKVHIITISQSMTTVKPTLKQVTFSLCGTKDKYHVLGTYPVYYIPHRDTDLKVINLISTITVQRDVLRCAVPTSYTSTRLVLVYRPHQFAESPRKTKTPRLNFCIIKVVM